MTRMREKRSTRRLFDDMAGVHHRDLIGHACHHAEIMRDEQQRHAGVFLQLAQQLEYLRLDRHVERGGGFVGDQQFGFAGHIVEQASRAAFFAHPRHPYSQKLFASLPERGKRGRKLAVIAGSVPSLAKPFRACCFVERCPHAWETCREVAPRFLETEPGTAVRCHLYDPEFNQASPMAAVEMEEGAPLAAAAPTAETLLHVV